MTDQPIIDTLSAHDKPCPHPATVTDEDGTRCDQCNEPFLGDAHQSELEKAHQTDGDGAAGETIPSMFGRITSEVIADLRAKLAEQERELSEERKRTYIEHGKLESAQAFLNSLSDDVTKAEAERDKLKAAIAAELDVSMRLRTDSIAALKKTEVDLATANERAEKALAELADAIAQLAAQRSETATMQRLARDARAEADALKARLAAIIVECEGVSIGAPSKWLADRIAKMAAGLEVAP